MTEDEPIALADIRAELLRDLTGMVSTVFHMPEKEASQAAERLFTAMRKAWGGRRIRFHSIKAEEKRQRALKMFTGENVDEVCSAIGISKSHFYTILKG